MKLRSNIVPVLCLVIGLITFPAMNQAVAQQLIEPPFYAPQRTSLMCGVFYADAGAKWWSLMGVDMKSNSRPVFGFAGGVFALESQALENRAWGPIFEVGYQQDSFFDVFGAFGWYNINDHIARDIQAIDLNGFLQTNHLAYQLDFTFYQGRVGGRSWYPLYGMGRIGVSLGAQLGVVPFKVSVNETIIGGPVLTAASHSDYWWHGAGFLGLDLELGYNRYFLKGSIEGVLGGPTLTYEDLGFISTKIKASAVSAAITGGIRF